MRKKRRAFRIFIILIVVIISGAFLLDFILAGDPPEIKKISDSNIKNYEEIKLTAHRGFSGIAPENTLAAFIKAGEYKFYAVECDVHLTKDGIWVINHDENIFRMTNGYKEIAECTYEELNEYVIDSGHFVNNYPTQKIPTLDKFLLICSEHNIVPQIEIKNGSSEKLQEILLLLDKYNLRENAIIISFNVDMLKKVRMLDSKIELWYLNEEITDEAITDCQQNSLALAFNYRKSDNETILDAGKKVDKLCAWTVDDLEALESLYNNCNIEYITTNSIIPQ